MDVEINSHGFFSISHVFFYHDLFILKHRDTHANVILERSHLPEIEYILCVDKEIVNSFLTSFIAGSRLTVS